MFVMRVMSLAGWQICFYLILKGTTCVARLPGAEKIKRAKFGKSSKIKIFLVQ